MHFLGAPPPVYLASTPNAVCCRFRSGASELPVSVVEKADMEEILDACLRTTAYLAVSRDHRKVACIIHCH